GVLGADPHGQLDLTAPGLGGRDTHVRLVHVGHQDTDLVVVIFADGSEAAVGHDTARTVRVVGALDLDVQRSARIGRPDLSDHRHATGEVHLHPVAVDGVAHNGAVEQLRR